MYMEINNKLSIKVSPDFFNEEVRNDYLVTSKTKKIWAVEMDLLSQLLKACKKFDIKVFVAFGTLLGAIRHKGFIPWDDDLDVIINREGFEKLKQVAPSEFKYPYFFQTSVSDPQYFFGYGRMRHSQTTGRILAYKSPNYNQGIYLDVYVVDGCINDDKLLKKQLRKLRFIFKIANRYKQVNDKQGFKYIVNASINLFFKYSVCKLISYDVIERWYYNTITNYSDVSDNVSLLVERFDKVRKSQFNKNVFNDIIYVPFENMLVPVPAAYDDMLTRQYGNYMDFPPIEERGEWHGGMLEFDPDKPYTESQTANKV